MNFSHIDGNGAKMVNVEEKPVTKRKAIASGNIIMKESTLKAILDNALPKGAVFETARIAGITAAKRTFELIPMCHNINLDGVDVIIEAESDSIIKVTATTYATAKTGVEMEAIVAVSTALITIYDMAKAVDRGMVITDIALQEKSGGKSGLYRRNA